MAPELSFIDGSLLVAIGSSIIWIAKTTHENAKWRERNDEIPERLDQIQAEQERIVRELRGAPDDETRDGLYSETQQAFCRMERDVTELRGDVQQMSDVLGDLVEALDESEELDLDVDVPTPTDEFDESDYRITDDD